MYTFAAKPQMTRALRGAPPYGREEETWQIWSVRSDVAVKFESLCIIIV